MKLKPILPSLREKKRYIAFSVESSSLVSFHETRREIEASMQQFLGDFGMAQAGLFFMKDWHKQQVILRVSSKYVDHARASFTFIETVAGHKAQVSSLAVSGVVDTLRKGHFGEG